MKPYVPVEEERANAGVFAERVRIQMAETLKAQLTPHSYDDVRLRHALKHKIGIAEPYFVMGDIFESYHVPTSKVIALIDVYKSFDKNQNGLIDFEEFCIITGIPANSTAAMRLFSLFDPKKNEIIDFEGFVMFVFIVTTEGHDREMMRILFALVRSDDGTDFEVPARFLEQSGHLELANELRQIAEKVPNKLVAFDQFVEQLSGSVHDVRLFLKRLMCARISGLSPLVLDQ